MRKIFLFLFAAVLSIGSAWAADIVINDGVFARQDGMWVMKGKHGTQEVTVNFYGNLDPFDVDVTSTYFAAIDLWDTSADEFAGGGEGDGTVAIADGKLTYTLDFEDWSTETVNHLEITATLPDPEAQIIDATYDMEMVNLQETDNGTTVNLKASGKYGSGWFITSYSFDLTLAKPDSGNEYTVSDATIIDESYNEYTFISGTLEKSETTPTTYKGQVITQNFEGMYIAFNLTMYYEAPAEHTLTIENADISWDYGTLVLTGTTSGTDCMIQFGSFEYTEVVNNKVVEGFQVGSYDYDGDYGYTNSITMSVDESKKITLSATYTSETANALYTITISGTLPTYTVTLNSSLAGATLTGAGTYVIGEKVTISATAPSAAWTFANWTRQNGTQYRNTASVDFDAEQDITLTANFVFELTENDNSAVLAENGTTANVKVKRGFTKDKLYTLSLPFAIADVTTVFGTGTVLYEYNGLTKDANEDLVMSFTNVSAVEAGKPYLIVPGKNIYSYNGFTINNATISSTENPISFTADGTTVTMLPVMSKLGSNGGKYWLAEDTYLYNDGVEVPALRVLFNISAPSGIAPRVRVALEENEATGFENIVSPEVQTLKVIENGQLIIVRDGVKYNVQGQMIR